ncbi:MAG TPA: Crp/Fnr family transcriptional regulator [Microscillaceae bacterium]|nr:Crp/Fnr family transcriptional regulator [Microscillaceae bacterium]
MENNLNIFDFDPNAKTRHYKKGEIIQRKGEVNGYTFYVKQGLLRSYIIDSKAKEHIFMFAPEGWVIADVESLEFHSPTELFIDCLEDAEVMIFNHDCLFQPESSRETIIQSAKRLYRRMGVLQRRVIMQMSSPAVDRYNYFVQTYAELAHRIPQHMIASYLGITPQALSTIRGKKIKK